MEPKGGSSSAALAYLAAQDGSGLLGRWDAEGARPAHHNVALRLPRLEHRFEAAGPHDGVGDAAALQLLLRALLPVGAGPRGGVAEGLPGRARRGGTVLTERLMHGARIQVYGQRRLQHGPYPPPPPPPAPGAVPSPEKHAPKEVERVEQVVGADAADEDEVLHAPLLAGGCDQVQSALHIVCCGSGGEARRVAGRRPGAGAGGGGRQRAGQRALPTAASLPGCPGQ